MDLQIRGGELLVVVELVVEASVDANAKQGEGDDDRHVIVTCTPPWVRFDEADLCLRVHLPGGSTRKLATTRGRKCRSWPDK